MKKTARSMGNRSIFAPKDGGDRLQGEITKMGAKRFEAARARLAHLVGRRPHQVSDGDTIEALSRGWPDTIAYIDVRLGETREQK